MWGLGLGYEGLGETGDLASGDYDIESFFGCDDLEWVASGDCFYEVSAVSVADGAEAHCEGRVGLCVGVYEQDTQAVFCGPEP